MSRTYVWRLALLLTLAFTFALILAAQEPKPTVEVARAVATAPVLTELQKATVQNLLLRIEIAQLKAQQAQQAFEAARAEITVLLPSLHVEGYTLDLQTLVYTPALKEEKKP